MNDTAEVALAATAAAPAAPAAPAHDALIERWFSEHFHGSVVAQHTHIYNHVRQGVDELKKRLAAAL